MVRIKASKEDIKSIYRKLYEVTHFSFNIETRIITIENDDWVLYGERVKNAINDIEHEIIMM